MVEGACALDGDEDGFESGWEEEDEIGSLLTSSCKLRATSEPQSDSKIEAIDLEEEVAVQVAKSA